MGILEQKNELFFTEIEKQILDSILSLEMYPSATEEEADEKTNTGDKLVSNLKNIHKRGRIIYESLSPLQTGAEDWKAPLKVLCTLDLVKKDNDEKHIYKLTTQGKMHAKQWRTERIGRYFGDILIRCDESKTYSSFCNQVFGKDLNQANLMDMEQLDKLLKVLNLNSENRVLDLACGVGRIAEYISDRTHAHVLGIDIGVEMIKRAQERTKGKIDRLEFQVGDLNNLSLDIKNVDTVIGIAALHFVEDLGKIISQLKKILPTRGQMGFFTFQYYNENDPAELLLPENTKLGQILKNANLRFQTWDFTDKEIAIRNKQIQIARDLMDNFKKEGNENLAQERIEECEIDLPRLEAGKKRRYLYHVQLS